jgi:hypothetical protein
MADDNAVEPKIDSGPPRLDHGGPDHGGKDEWRRDKSAIHARLEELEALPKRNATLHWVAFTLALVSVFLLAKWGLGTPAAVPTGLILLDIGLGAIFAGELLTRSGFRWQRGKYLRSHFFDFVAIVPALALIGHGFAVGGGWVWLIMVARCARLVDRFLGDGFVTRNALAVVEGFEEEITDRVMERIVARLQGDLDRAGFSHAIAEALVRNRTAVLERVRAATPRDGLVPSIARMVGLDAALERAEERSYDAIVGIIDSEEVDRSVRDMINSSFESIRSELGRKTWRQHIGIRRRGAK